MNDDNIIITRCQAGQLESLTILVNRYKKPLYSFCNKLGKNNSEVDDLFQDTWVKAIKNIHLCSPDKRFINWLFSICINHYRDRYRKYVRWLKVIREFHSASDKETEMVKAECKELGPDMKALNREQQNMVRNALSKLKDNHRIPIILYYYREFSLNEISQILSIPIGTVKSRLATGRRFLKQTLEVSSNERK